VFIKKLTLVINILNLQLTLMWKVNCVNFSFN